MAYLNLDWLLDRSNGFWPDNFSDINVAAAAAFEIEKLTQLQSLSAPSYPLRSLERCLVCCATVIDAVESRAAESGADGVLALWRKIKPPDRRSPSAAAVVAAGLDNCMGAAASFLSPFDQANFNAAIKLQTKASLIAKDLCQIAEAKARI